MSPVASPVKYLTDSLACGVQNRSRCSISGKDSRTPSVVFSECCKSDSTLKTNAIMEKTNRCQGSRQSPQRTMLRVLVGCSKQRFLSSASTPPQNNTKRNRRLLQGNTPKSLPRDAIYGATRASLDTFIAASPKQQIAYNNAAAKYIN